MSDLDGHLTAVRGEEHFFVFWLTSKDDGEQAEEEEEEVEGTEWNGMEVEEEEEEEEEGEGEEPIAAEVVVEELEGE